MGMKTHSLDTMPVLPAGYWILQEHYDRLNRSRSYNMGGPNPIAFSEIERYNHTIARLDLEFFVDVIQMLDSFHLDGDKKTVSKKEDSAPKK